MTYDPYPHYPVAGGEVETGFEALARELVRTRPRVLAVDGPAALAWEPFVARLARAAHAAGLAVELVDARRFLAPWPEIERRTASAVLPGDPVFGRLFDGTLADLVGAPPAEIGSGDSDVTVLFGPGSALFTDGSVWLADRPKREALAAVAAGEASNVGREPGTAGSVQRLLFVDWPLLDRHRQGLLTRLDRYVDVSDVDAPLSLDGEALRRSLAVLARRPFRARPHFLPGAWGGQWLRRELGIETDAPNLAWSYELITPESGLLLGEGPTLEVGFELLLAAQADDVLGAEVASRFGGEFPIRFDYLDTVDGGHLSLQCHPRERYAREVFGLAYTQLESYYVLATTPGAKVFLGLREDADTAAFLDDAERAQAGGVAFEAERHVQAHAAERHRLYLIPGGTVHASGAGNLVLEISATPYLYTLRFYDWLRRDLADELRPVHLEHAFANLDPARRGAGVRQELVPEPRVVRGSDGSAELVLGRHPELFFAVHRLDFADEIADAAAGRFHVLNLVEGEEVELETESGDGHALSYAETLVVPAAAGGYRVRRVRGPACKLVKAFVA